MDHARNFAAGVCIALLLIIGYSAVVKALSPLQEFPHHVQN